VQRINVEKLEAKSQTTKTGFDQSSLQSTLSLNQGEFEHYQYSISDAFALGSAVGFRTND
jgi:hypothetical protein